MRWTALLLLMLLCLTSCANSAPTDDEVGSENEQTGEDDAPADEMLILSKDGKTDYQIVCPLEYMDQNIAMQSMLALTGHLEENIDAKVPCLTEDEAEMKTREILVGIVRHRPETEDAALQITAPDRMGFRISVSGEKIIIACEQPRLLSEAFAALTRGIQTLPDGSCGISKRFAAAMDVPAYGEDITPKICYTGEGNHTVTYGATNYMTYKDYLTRLTDAGFVEHASNHVGRNYFATYVKDTAVEKVAVHTMFYEKMMMFEMTYGPLDEYIPPAETVSTGSTGKVTPSVTQIGRNGATQNAPGMSTIFQLEDASFIIFDGGPYDVQDEMELFNFMKERTPEGQKPVIAAWVITHAHGDHMGLALNFLRTHRNDVVLKLGAFNFPDFDSITIQNESASNMKSMAVSFQNLVLSYPDAECWVMHTGQRLLLPGCEMQVLYTPEDSGSTKFAWGNHTCTAVRVKLNNTVVTILGDAEQSLCQQMADAYGSSIKSDILSLSHHGFNGACLDLYKYVNPSICFWPVDGARFRDDPRCTGTAGGYSFNAWLRNEAIRVREHYTADQTHTVYC